MVVVLLEFALQVRFDRVLDHVFEEQAIFRHPLERLDQIRLKREVVTKSLRDVGKELYPSFVHEARLLWHVFEVHGVVEEVLLEREKQRSKFDWTLATGLKLR